MSASGNSKEQEQQAKHDKSRQDQPGIDKKLNGPNRPST
ncbi:spore protein [Paenibacillus sp. N1-5-1-14]|nr:spore protein [Paenibacillus radicibacter]MCR8643110.1 spore protein [Paenibacillus radicibacter]